MIDVLPAWMGTLEAVVERVGYAAVIIKTRKRGSK